MKHEKEAGSPPTIGKVAQDVLGAMCALDPAKPLGLAVATDGNGTNLYMVAVVLGDANIQRVKVCLEELRKTLATPDTFT